MTDKKVIAAEIKALLEELRQYSGTDPRHAAILAEIERLNKLLKGDRPWWKALLDPTIIAALIGAMVSIIEIRELLYFEEHGTVRSRAFSLMHKPRL